MNSIPLIFFHCQNTYPVFLKLEQDINNNIPVPFYFKPREREKLNSCEFSSKDDEAYLSYVNTTLRNSITHILQNYGDKRRDIVKFSMYPSFNYKILDQYSSPANHNWQSKNQDPFYYLTEVIYNSFKILFLISYSNYSVSAILVNYFQYDESYIIDESCFIPKLTVDTRLQYMPTINGVQYINTYEPYLDFKKKGKSSIPFWTSVENFMNGINGSDSYSYYQLGTLFLVYDYHSITSENLYNQGF